MKKKLFVIVGFLSTVFSFKAAEQSLLFFSLPRNIVCFGALSLFLVLKNKFNQQRLQNGLDIMLERLQRQRDQDARELRRAQINEILGQLRDLNILVARVFPPTQENLDYLRNVRDQWNSLPEEQRNQLIA